MADHDELVKELRAAVAEFIDADGPISLERLSNAWKALDRAERPAVPTEPGAYYLTDGRVAMVEPDGTATHYIEDRTVYVDKHALTWATEDGAVVRVPTWEEWRLVVASNQAGADAVTELGHVNAQLGYAGLPVGESAALRVQALRVERDALHAKLARIERHLRRSLDDGRYIHPNELLGGDCGPVPPTWEEWRAAKTPCTCGSGGHPRRCERHPLRIEAHCRELAYEADRDEREEALRERAEKAEARVSELLEVYNRWVAANTRLGATINDLTAERDRARLERDAALARGDDLDEEADVLRARVADLEEQRDALRAKLDAITATLRDETPLKLQRIAAAMREPVSNADELPQRCVDCAHNIGGPAHSSCTKQGSGPAGEWVRDRWESDTAPQPIPCPAFKRKETP